MITKYYELIDHHGNGRLDLICNDKKPEGNGRSSKFLKSLLEALKTNALDTHNEDLLESVSYIETRLKQRSFYTLMTYFPSKARCIWRQIEQVKTQINQKKEEPIQNLDYSGVDENLIRSNPFLDKSIDEEIDQAGEDKDSRYNPERKKPTQIADGIENDHITQLNLSSYLHKSNKANIPESPMLKLTQEEIENAIFQGKEERKHQLKQPQDYVLYSLLGHDVKERMRKEMYKSLFPLVANAQRNRNVNSIYLYFMTGFEGEKISIYTEGNRLIVKAVPTNWKFDWSITLQEDGEVCFETLEQDDEGGLSANPKKYWVKVYNDTRLEVENESRLIRDTPKKDRFCGQSTEDYYYRGYSIIQLILYKWDAIVSYLIEEEVLLKKIFESCLSLYENLAIEKLSSITSNNRDGEQLIGPLFNPVLASQDSCFTWRRWDQTFSFEKEFIRPMHESGKRAIHICYEVPNQLKIEIEKSDVYRYAEASKKRSSEYILTIKDQKVIITPASQETEIEYGELEPWIVQGVAIGLAPITKIIRKSDLQNDVEIAEDVEFIVKTLSTIQDFLESPHTMLLHEKASEYTNLAEMIPFRGVSKDILEDQVACYNFEGEMLPLWWIERLTEFPQSCNDHILKRVYHLKKIG